MNDGVCSRCGGYVNEGGGCCECRTYPEDRKRLPRPEGLCAMMAHDFADAVQDASRMMSMEDDANALQACNIC